MAYIYDLTDTWNAGGTTFNAIKMNVTDSASAAGSKLVTLQTNGTEHFSVTKAGVGYFSGNVGVGTSSPGSPLDVQTNSSALGISLRGRSSDNVSSLAVRSNDGATIYGQVQGRSTDFRLEASSSNIMTMYTNSSERMRITSAGNVGIGTSSPTSISNYKAITLDATTGTFIDFRENGTNRLRIGGDGGTAFVNGASGTLRLLTSDVERARIDSSGNLLVGTTSVNGDGISIKPRASAGSTSQINFNRASSTTTGYPIVFQNGGTDVGYISHNNTTTTYATSSDARLKHDIVNAPSASGIIDAIKVRSFKWNADNSEQRYGMIAQELLEVAPEAVSHDPDDEEKMMGIDYSKLVPMLVKEIQSLRARVAQLEGN